MNHENVEQIIERVAARYGLTVAELRSKDRHKSIARARHVAFWVLRQTRKMSFPELGRAMGKRDHTTAMNAVRSIEAKRLEDLELAAELEEFVALVPRPTLRKTTVLDELEWLTVGESELNHLDRVFMQPESEVRTA